MITTTSEPSDPQCYRARHALHAPVFHRDHGQVVPARRVTAADTRGQQVSPRGRPVVRLKRRLLRIRVRARAPRVREYLKCLG